MDEKRNYLKNDKTGSFYGNYSFGNIYDSLLDKKNIKELKKIIFEDLKKGKIINNLKDKIIMDVGTGRQSLALSSLGAKKVYHYDISSKHVARFKYILKHKFPRLDIISKKKNIVLDRLETEKFDIVFLNGIIQHFSSVVDGLFNCAQSVKVRGKIWCYFYRSGTFRWFVVEMIRKITPYINLNDFFTSSSILYNLGNTKSTVVSEVMDDLYVPYINLYTPKQYINYMNKLGFKIHKKINLNNLSNIDHLSHHSSVIVFEKIIKTPKLNELNKSLLLNKRNSINQLNKKNYKKNSEIYDCIILFEKILKKITKKTPKTILFSLCLSLHQISNKLFYEGKEFPPNYKKLKNLLNNFNNSEI